MGRHIHAERETTPCANFTRLRSTGSRDDDGWQVFNERNLPDDECSSESASWAAFEDFLGSSPTRYAPELLTALDKVTAMFWEWLC